MKLALRYMAFIIIMHIFLLNGNSQTADSTDFKLQIKKTINDSLSDFYYPKLIDKIKNHPSDINVDDCYYLYYGWIFQKDYKPLSFVSHPELGDFYKAVARGACRKALSYGITILDRNPVDLTVLLHVCDCIKKTGSPDTTYFFEKRFNNLVNGIFTTGNGNSIKTAIKIVGVEDDHVLKGILGFFGGVETFRGEKKHTYSVWEKSDRKLFFEDVVGIDYN